MTISIKTTLGTVTIALFLLLAGLTRADAVLLLGGSYVVTPPSSDPTVGLLPADRDAWPNWKMAGLLSIGGIPNRTTQCGATLTPLGSGQDDAPQIQTAINNCTAGDYVQLGAGTFTIAVASYVNLNKSITLRGAGAGSTILQRPTDLQPGSNGPYPCPPNSASGINYGCYQGNGSHGMLVRVSGFADNTNPTYTACALTADTTFAATSLSVTSGCAGNFHVGDIVLLDEDGGTQWMPDSESTTGSTATSVCANEDYRIVYEITNSSGGTAGDANSCPPTSQSGVYSAYTLNANRLTNEMHKISAVSGATITFDSPIMQTYRVSHSADLWYFSANAFLQQAGVENMSLRYSTSPIQFWYCAYCWVKDTNIAYGGADVVAVWASFRTQIESNYVHECAWPSPGEACYQLDQKYDSTESLFWDNISVLANKVTADQSSGAGSVYAYNYMDKGYIEGDCCWQEMGLNASHLTGPHHILFEGNWGFNMDSDDTHGGSNHITFFRNWSTGVRNSFQGLTQGFGATTNTFTTWNDAANTCGTTGYSGSPLRATGPAAHSYWFSFIGNVLGTPGCTGPPFPLQNGYGGSQNSDGIFLIGWFNIDASVDDPITQTIYPATPPTITCASGLTCAVSTASCTTYGSNCATILLGNYDTVNGAQEWQSNCSTPTIACTTGSSQTLPNSFFLTSAPAFFSGYTWPWVVPSTGTTITLPALDRYTGNGCATAVFQNGTDCEPFGAVGPPTITGVTLSPSSNFATPAAANSTIYTLSPTCSGNCTGATLALSTAGSCSAAANNSSFAISGSNLNIGGSTVNAGTYTIGIQVTLSNATNNGVCYPKTLIGTSAPTYFSLVAHTIAISTNSGASVSTPAINTTGAGVIVVSVDETSSTLGTLSDTAGNTWHALSSPSYGGPPWTSILEYCAPCTTSTSDVFTYSQGSSYPTIVVAAFSDSNGTPTLDQHAVAPQNGSSVTTIQAGAVTPTVGSSLIVAGLAHNHTSGSVSIDSGLTISDQNLAVNNQGVGGAMAYLLQAPAVSTNPTWTLPASDTPGAAIATFKP